MMEYTKQARDNEVVLQLSGELTIGQADELRSVLVDLFTEADTVEIDVSSTTEADVACLQLFCASHKTAVQLGKQVRFVNRWSDPFTETVQESGFIRDEGCSLDAGKECLWAKEQNL